MHFNSERSISRNLEGNQLFSRKLQSRNRYDTICVEKYSCHEITIITIVLYIVLLSLLVSILYLFTGNSVFLIFQKVVFREIF